MLDDLNLKFMFILDEGEVEIPGTRTYTTTPTVVPDAPGQVYYSDKVSTNHYHVLKTQYWENARTGNITSITTKYLPHFDSFPIAEY